MLRTVLSRASRPFVGINRSFSAHLNPSTTTSVLLSKLSSATVESDLKEALASVDCRRIEMEPGCSLHFVSESEANVAAKFLKSTLKAETMISRTTMPCLSLQNLPEVLSSEALSRSFASHSPQTIHVNDSNTLQMTVSGCEDAIKAVGALNKLNFDGRQLKTTTTKVDGGKYVINMFNIPPNGDVSTAKQTINNTLGALKLQNSTAVQPATQFAKKTVTLRFSAKDNVAAAELQAALNKKSAGAFAVSEVRDLKRPALFLRNIEHIEDESLETLFADYLPSIERIQLLRPKPARLANMAVVYFRSEEAAFACLGKLHSAVVDGERIAVAYREVAEPAVRVKNLPDGTTEENLKAFCANIPVERIEMQADNSAVLICGSPREAKLAYQALHDKVMGEGAAATVLRAQVTDILDRGVDVTLAQGSKAELSAEVVAAALKELEAQPKSMALQTNVNASIGFLTATEAQKALDRFVRGDIRLGGAAAASTAESAAGSMVASSVGTLPAYVLQVLGLPVTVPVSKVTEALAAGVPDAAVIKTDRSAMVKFRRHRDVVPGMKALKALNVHGEKFRVEPYRPLESEGDSEYDVVTGKKLKGQVAIGKFSLSAVLQDFMHLDPATRYQIAKNEFQRELFDARADPAGLEMLFPEGENLSEAAWDEIDDLFNGYGIAEDMTDEEAENRLFQIYLQLEEMDRYTSDFRDIQAIMGPAKSGPLDWSSFDLDNDRDMDRILEELRLCDEGATEELLEKAGKRVGRSNAQAVTDSSDSSSDSEGSSSSSSDSESDSEGEEMTPEMEAAEKRERRRREREPEESEPELDDDGNVIEKPNKEFLDEQGNTLNLVENKYGDLIDADGTVWSMVVLNTDTVQKTMPGNRVVSHRALVMLGNMKGAGGFAMGKGKTPDAALTAACRNALRHLVHIDLYDNFGLAHNLFGRHNSCYCYITATPSYREMVASPFASEVLNRFGISSASVKLVGNRNPYSQINAIFNALSKHENIDEIAKDRGKRYLSVRWAHDRNL